MVAPVLIRLPDVSALDGYTQFGLATGAYAESTMWMIKSKFSEHIRSKTDRAIVNELLCKVLCHNICVVIASMYELGIEPTFWTETALA